MFPSFKYIFLFRPQKCDMNFPNIEKKKETEKIHAHVDKRKTTREKKEIIIKQ